MEQRGVMRVETERLALREFAEDDWRAVLAYQREPAYLRFYPWEDRSEQDARSFVNTFIAWRRKTPAAGSSWRSR